MRQTGPSTILVELPDGLVSEFQKAGNTVAGTDFCGGGVSGCWRLKETRDLYGNKVSFAYAVDGTSETWTVSDSTGREHTLVFSLSDEDTGGGDGGERTSTQEGDEPGDVRRVLKSANLAAFGGSTATYLFETEVKSLVRPCPNEWEDVQSLYSLQTPVLRSVTPPEDVQPWEITTHTPFSTNTACVRTSGRVQEIQLPTLGKIAYDYGPWRMATRCTYQNSPTAEPEYVVDGVVKRTTKFRDDTVEGERVYSSLLHPTITSDPEISGPNCTRANFRKTTVNGAVDAAGKHTRTIHFNAVAQGPMQPRETDVYEQWQVTDHGLPYSKHASITGTDDRKLFLSQEIYHCTGESCARKRTVYRRYTSEFRSCVKTAGDSAGCYQVHPQQVAERTIFNDDGGRWRETLSVDNAGSGRFRVTTVSDNFADTDEAAEARTTRTAYTATGNTVLSLDPVSGYLDPGSPTSYLPGSGEDWLLSPYSQVSTEGDGRTYVTESLFNDEGSVTCLRRRQDADARGPRDVVIKLTLGTDSGTNLGLPTTEVVSGGTYGQLATDTLCAVDTTTADGRKYTYLHGYEHLQLASTTFSGFSHDLYRADIDRNTGLESNVYDVSDLRTGLSFDRLGRLTHVSPEDAVAGIHTEYVYSHPPNGDTQVEISHRTPPPVSTLSKETQVFDAFGRMISESSRKPEGSSSFSISVRTTTYDALGRITRSTTRQASDDQDEDESWRYGDYDAFDRAGKITAPDGTVETLDHDGIRRRASTVQIRTSTAGTTSVTRTTFYDSLGRTIATSNPEQSTAYTYDPYDRRVSARRTGTGIDQTRTYGYDARGYLLSEALPEVTGTVSYQPDALGLPRQMFDGLNTLKHVYDGAGRLTRVEDLSGQVWKTLAYGTANDGSNRRKGKVIRATRHNRLSDVTAAEDLDLVETYEYRGAHGKLSRKVTGLYFPERPEGSRYGAAFEQHTTYDRFGNPASQSYPACTPNADGTLPCADGNDTPAPAHTVSMGFNQGMVTSVGSSLGPSAALSYHSNFQLAQLDYGNGVTGTFDEGQAHMPRPRKIEYTDAADAVLWSTGTYGYDGAGNITSIGTNDYLYDGAGRLRSGTVHDAGLSRLEELTYDAADNVRSFQRDSGTTITHNVDPVTNRLKGRNGANDIMYDGAGSILSVGLWPDQRPIFAMSYGPFRRQTSFEVHRNDPGFPSRSWTYAYGPGDTRLMVEDRGGERRWTFRDSRDRVLREFLEQNGAWHHERDFIYTPGGLLATRHHNGTVRYFHADHLGTPRLFTATDGAVFSRHHYYPFGGEIEDAASVLTDDFESGDMRYWLESKHEPRVEYTGHERDANGLTDYMLARTYLYPLFRFSSVDPARDDWNLYAYTHNSPISYTDPTGELSTREGASIVVSLTPGVGDLKDVQEFVLGVDLITGEKLTTGERIITGVAILVPVLGGALIREGLQAAAKGGDEVVDAAERVVIGKLEDLENLRPGEKPLISEPLNRGNPRANWKQNAGLLRREMSKGKPIGDKSIDSGGVLTKHDGFLRAERDLMQTRGWTFDRTNQLWTPPRQ